MSARTTFGLAVLVAALSWVPGCTADSSSQGEKQDAAEAAPGGAQLWAENCGRCHNLRSPSSFTSAQWEAVVAHMRVRCTLNGADARAITEFLKAGAGNSASAKE